MKIYLIEDSPIASQIIHNKIRSIKSTKEYSDLIEEVNVFQSVQQIMKLYDVLTKNTNSTEYKFIKNNKNLFFIDKKLSFELDFDGNDLAKIIKTINNDSVCISISSDFLDIKGSSESQNYDGFCGKEITKKTIKKIIKNRFQNKKEKIQFI